MTCWTLVGRVVLLVSFIMSQADFSRAKLFDPLNVVLSVQLLNDNLRHSLRFKSSSSEVDIPEAFGQHGYTPAPTRNTYETIRESRQYDALPETSSDVEIPAKKTRNVCQWVKEFFGFYD